MPAFYTSKSGYKVDYRVDSPSELADFFRTHMKLGMKGGILVGNPIPDEYSMDPAIIDPAIDQAIQECIDLGIKGKETTPFLLAKVKEITGGDSLDSNIRLVFNNAKVAALTAAELCK
jgi:pseudouridine-5'-phosphate glycosidase